MTAAERRDAESLIDMLRGKGVRTFKGFGIELELAPTPAKEPVATPEVNAGRCACGHMDYEHQNGLCVATGGGCDPTVCAKVET